MFSERDAAASFRVRDGVVERNTVPLLRIVVESPTHADLSFNPTETANANVDKASFSRSLLDKIENPHDVSWEG